MLPSARLNLYSALFILRGMVSTERLVEDAEKEWLEIWVSGPGDNRSKPLDPGTSAGAERATARRIGGATAYLLG